ncbi:transporter substrate-binding domain-containing protein [Gallaecimonas sp. GXIMD4217]|uniref:substrate-binding periplasmic protein n=1 Tax=Gallaecimonas sp. GXIMD4217 TaxID=3131927 RepID=UPI00311B3C9A
MMRILASFLLVLCLPLPAATLYLASLEWPPYASNDLAEQGQVIRVTRQALAAMGHELQVDFFPWQRAVALVDGQSRYLGYLPEYASAQVAARYQLSDPIGSGPLALAYRKDDPIPWRHVQELQRYRIGVVRDYVNTEAFDLAVAAGKQRVDLADSDRQNIMKLVHGRVRAIVIDPRVLDHWLDRDPLLQPYRDQLAVSPRLLDDKSLYVAFRNSEEGRHWQRILNEGLRRLGN